MYKILHELLLNINFYKTNWWTCC